MKDEGPLKRAWNIFSGVGGVIGTASLVDGIFSWGPFVSSILSGYEATIRPIFAFIGNLVSAPNWFADYLFIGVLLSSARSRATYNLMHDHWLLDVSEYSPFNPLAPHKLATILLGVLIALFWPLAVLLFLRKGPYENEKTAAFQLAIWRAQWEWLGVYAIGLLSLLILNSAAEKIGAAL